MKDNEGQLFSFFPSSKHLFMVCIMCDLGSRLSYLQQYDVLHISHVRLPTLTLRRTSFVS